MCRLKNSRESDWKGLGSTSLGARCNFTSDDVCCETNMLLKSPVRYSQPWDLTSGVLFIRHSSLQEIAKIRQTLFNVFDHTFMHFQSYNEQDIV